MTYTVTIKNDLYRENYFFQDPNADLTINRNLTCITSVDSHSAGVTLSAKNVTINGPLNCKEVIILANSILVNNRIRSQEQIELTSEDFLDLNAEISSYDSQISLTAKRIILREDLHSSSFSEISADKILLLGDIKSLPLVRFSIKDYIIKVGSLPLDGNGFEYYPPEKELKDVEEIKKALVDDFNIQEPELSQILEKCIS